MIAKVHAIAHGAAMTSYAMDKAEAEIVETHLLPDDLSPSALWGRMMLHIRQTEGLRRGNNEMKNFAIRIELSPSRDETEGWTIQDWKQLAKEFIREFDAVDMTHKHKRKKDAHTNLSNTQYVVALHHDSESGIPHLHIVANRVDMDGHLNNDHFIRERGWEAVDIINLRRGWELPKDIREKHIKEISDDCMEVLRHMNDFTWSNYAGKLRAKGYMVNLRADRTGKVVGYTVWMGNSHFKASELGKARKLTASKIENTWQELHPKSEQKDVATFETGQRPASQFRRPEPSRKDATKPKSLVERYSERLAAQERQPARYVKDIPHKDGNCHIDIPQALYDLMGSEASVHPGNTTTTLENVLHIALLLFAGYVDAATAMSESCGGGGSQPESGWGRDKDEDERDWACRCARMASKMSKPKITFRRGR